MRKPLIAGNWKMNGLRADLGEIQAMAKGATVALRRKADLLICPPATVISKATMNTIGTGIAIGAQDCHAKASGAHTGDVSAAMLFDAGATAVIVGHSERRTDHAEKDADVKAKAEAVIGQGMLAIICVGETRAEREAGKALAVVRRQLRGSVPAGGSAADIVVAYEPVWAIGTGKTATPEQAQAVHAFIRGRIAALDKGVAEGLTIQYGGSVKAANAAELMTQPDIDGGLIGGASLIADEFAAICKAAAR